MTRGCYANMRPLLAHEMAIQQQAAAQRATTDSSQILDVVRDMSAKLGDMSARLGNLEARE